MNRAYDHDTGFEVTYPWGLFRRCRAVCPDGVVRSIRVAQTADTFFSVPASLTISRSGKRYTVSGFVTVSDSEDYAKKFVEFCPHSNAKHVDTVFPERPFISSRDLSFAAKYSFSRPAVSKPVRA